MNSLLSRSKQFREACPALQKIDMEVPDTFKKSTDKHPKPSRDLISWQYFLIIGPYFLQILYKSHCPLINYLS